MKHLLIFLSLLALLSPAKAQSSASLAANLQSAENWADINALLIAQRNELNAAHIASLATAAADFTTQLNAANTAKNEVLAKYEALKTEIGTVLNSTLTDLQSQLSTAQAALTAELATGDGPQAAAKRLVVTDIEARMDTINALIIEAGKSEKQKAVDAARAAKAAAEKALSDAQAALGN
jgi:hypothetical protein